MTEPQAIALMLILAAVGVVMAWVGMRPEADTDD
jgi:hypothetical protein